MKKSKPDPGLAGREIYYAGWGSYRIPFVPQEEISEQQARSRRTYYVGRYDSEGRLARFDKYLDGEREWTDEYAYWDNGRLNERVILKSDGSQTVQRFDRKGKLLDQ